MIKVQDVSFAYDSKAILKEVNLTEAEPVIVGLWGRNGSGKTTLMKLLAGLEKPNTGTIEVNGVEPYNNSEAMHQVTFMQEDHPYSDLWDVDDVLNFAQDFNRNWDRDLAIRLIEIFELPRNKKIRTFSKGMKTMITIVIGLASKSPVTIFDEPSNGLDAYMRKQFYDVLLDTYEESPRLIIISSHHIEEIAPLCEKIAIIDGRTLMHYEDTEILKNKGVHVVGPADAVERFTSDKKILDTRQFGSRLNVMLDEPYTNQLKRQAEDIGLKIEKAKFQDYLVHLTGQEVHINEHA